MQHWGHTIRSCDGCHRIEELVSKTIGQWFTYNQPAFLDFEGKSYMAFPYDFIVEMRIKPEFLTEEAVLEKIQETNTCESLGVPVIVYIDPDGNYSVDVWD